MKKLIASAGLVAMGTAGLHADDNMANLSRQEASKPWSVSAALRGFYDDNYATLPSATKQGSGGIEISPTLSWNLPRETTYLGLSYTYDLKYYFDRAGGDNDQSHDFTAKLDHRFSNRYSVNFEDSFVYSSEPELIDQSQSTALRSEATAERNHATINFQGLLTEMLGFRVGYANLWYNYLDSGAGSRSALLDRFEHLPYLEGTWLFREQSVAKLGYRYGVVNYTGSEPVRNNGSSTKGSARDNDSHTIYVGAKHNFTSKLSVDGDVGVRLTDYSNPNEADSFSPSVDVSVAYAYLPGSSVRLGLRHDRAATDSIGQTGELTQDQALTAVYGEWNHRITPMLTGSLVSRYQTGTFNGGNFDGLGQNLFLLGLSFSYHINQYWSAEAGYNWDRLDSDLPGQSFTRNQVFLGVRAAY